MYSRQILKQKTQAHLREAHQIKQLVKEAISKCTLFRELDEGFFKNHSALHFCQLAFLSGGFIEKSTLS
jgi:hypothetical protein